MADRVLGPHPDGVELRWYYSAADLSHSVFEFPRKAVVPSTHKNEFDNENMMLALTRYKDTIDEMTDEEELGRLATRIPRMDSLVSSELYSQPAGAVEAVVDCPLALFV